MDLSESKKPFEKMTAKEAIEFGQKLMDHYENHKKLAENFKELDESAAKIFRELIDRVERIENAMILQSQAISLLVKFLSENKND